MKGITIQYFFGTKHAINLLKKTYYTSDTYAKLQDSKTGFYFQSPKYVYTFLKTELEKGKMA